VHGWHVAESVFETNRPAGHAGRQEWTALKLVCTLPSLDDRQYIPLLLLQVTVPH
jgi:hypothetical protein